MENSRIVAALRAAFATKGKNAGRLLAKCPPSTTDAAAAWQACMVQSNPYKVGMITIMLFTDDQMKIYGAIGHALDSGKIDVRDLDRDRAALESLGVW